MDDHATLGNSYQHDTVDCVLHCCIVPALVVNDMELSVLGSSAEESRLVCIKIQQHMALTIHQREYMFNTNHIDVDQTSRYNTG